MANKENIDTPLKTRSSSDYFNWKEHCFICGCNCDPIYKSSLYGYSRSWSYVDDSISTDSNSIYNEVLKTALEINDTTIIDRLSSVANGDLVALEARYHRRKGCLATYLSYGLNNEGRTPPKNECCESDKYNKIYKRAAERLKEEYEHFIVVQNKVYYLTKLRERFIQLAKDEGCETANTYKSSYLKKLLSAIWPDIAFVHHHGKSDLVCSRNKTISDAIREAKVFEHAIEEDGECSYITESETESDETIVHKAIEILRRRVIDYNSKLDTHPTEYCSPNEMNISAQVEFCEPLLYRAICWLSDRDCFNAATKTTNRKCIAIASDITTLITANPSPKHLGLAVHLYQEFNSRHIIEDLSALGYTITYPDLRMFLTSAANQAIKSKKVTPSGGIVPDNIVPKQKGGKLVVAVADNWDHNERTVDGKRTTHAMTSILVSSTSVQNRKSQRLQKSQSRTFDKKLLPGGTLCSIISYKKPSHRPTPFFENPITLDEINPLEPNVVKRARIKELLYLFGRCSVFCDDFAEDNKVPNWSVFSANISTQSKQAISTIIYNPIIMAKPSDYSTVYTTLLRAKEVMHELGQSHIPVVFDMGLLSKALEIVWSQVDTLKGVIPIEGGMHLLMSIFAGIGFLYGDAGLKHLLTDAGTYAPATAANILTGKDFDRALTAYKLIDEVLYSRLLTNFENWCLNNNKDLHHDVTSMLSKLRCINDDSYAQSEIQSFCEIIAAHVVPLLDEFRDEGRKTSPTFLVWDDYLSRVSTPMKLLLTSTRSPDWTVHQYAKLQLMPLLFASNRTTYAKYMAIQILTMNRLPTEVEEGFLEGFYTSKLASGNFNNVWLDYTLEVTQNKALKGSGGIIGLTLRENSLARCFLARPLTSQYSMVFHESIGRKSEDDKTKHHSDTKAKRESYDRTIAKMINLFDNNYIDPFDLTNAPEKLVNFATGLHATYEVQQSMTQCLDRGHTMLESFVSERLIQKSDGSDPPEKNIFNPMQRSNVKTMSDMKGKTVKLPKAEIINGATMFQRLLAINAYKKVPSERVFAFENTTVPLSMFSDEGKMLKTKKSDFMIKLEEMLPHTLKMTDNPEVVIFDGMAIVQILPVNSAEETFAEMAAKFQQYTLNKARDISPKVAKIHIIFDRYDINSLKTETRKDRGDNNNFSLCKNVDVRGELKVPKDWKMFLRSGENKERLIQFYIGYMVEHACNKLKPHEELVLNGGKNTKCVTVTTDRCSNRQLLDTNQEEADTIMILHAKYEADRGSTCIAIHSPDTDVLVLMLHHYHSIGSAKLYMSTGRATVHTDGRRFIPVHRLICKLNEEHMNIMLLVYCITGCDTTSSFFGKGKRRAFKILMERAAQYQSLYNMGEELLLSNLHLIAATKFVISLYGGNETQTLHQLRCIKAKSSVHPRNIPPTLDNLSLHLQRCVIQLWIWRHATQARHDLPPLSEFGYDIDENGCITPKMMSQAAAAPELLNDIICECDICCETCVCFANQQPCTVACCCTGNTSSDDIICTNVYTLKSVFVSESIESSDDDQL